MKINPTSLPGVYVIEPKRFGDHRGYFMELYREDLFREFGISTPFVQDNQSSSVKGTLRGLHLQRAPKGQAKLVRAVSGSIFDVAVDVRPDSPTYKQWFGIELSAENHKMLYLPADFAHGFYVQSDHAEIHYKVSDTYSPEHERTLLWNDPSIGIQWPLSKTPILSEKDKNGLSLKDFICS